MVAVGNGVAYGSTENTIIAFHKADNSIERLSKVNGLSDLNISAIRFHEATGQLVVGYTNGNIDLLTNTSTHNLGDIERSNVIGDKAIYDIHFEGNLAYLSCGFGIVVLDLPRKEIKDTYYIGPSGSQIKVNGVALASAHIYAATDNGLYYASLTGSNLTDFSSWTKDVQILQNNGPFNEVAYFNNTLFVNYRSTAYNSDTLYFIGTTGWQVYSPFLGLAQNGIRVVKDKLVVAQNGNVRVLNEDLSESSNIFKYTFGPLQANQGTIDSEGFVWIADETYGLVKAADSWNNEKIVAQGPQSKDAYRLDAQKGKVAVATGGVFLSSYNNQYKKEGFFMLEDGSWDYVSRDKSSALDTVFDYMDVAINPTDLTEVFAGTWGRGVVHSQGGAFRALFDQTNSTLLEESLKPQVVSIGALAFDKEGNLWVGNAYSSKGLHCRLANGNWVAMDAGSAVASNELISQIMIDSRGYIWASVLKSSGSISGKGLLVYNPNGTPSDISDDEFRLLTTSGGNGALPDNFVNCMAEDLDGEIWLGTNTGVAVIYTPESIFGEGQFDAQQILVQQDGSTQILLEAEIVTAIAIDGANQKWLGTATSGVFLMSQDGINQVFGFNQSNSPLFTNNINDIAINNQSGAVFIATDKGILSFQGYATAGRNAISEVLVYPNPVRPNYDGLIGIKGLAAESQVRITDVAGNVVHESESYGGQAVWDGKDMYGQRVATGVYLVFSTDKAGELTNVTKILFVN